MRIKLLLTLFIVWLLPFVFTAFFNHPAIDDYWNANAVNAYGKIGAVRYFYHTVSGRYFSLLLMSFCNTLPKGGIWIFKAWPIFIIAFLFTSFYFFFGSFFTQQPSKSNAVLLSSLFVVCHIAGMRSLFEGLYWMSSTVCYQLSICLFASGIGAIVRDAKKPSVIMKSIAIVSTLLLPGTVEMVIPVYFFTLLLLLYFSYKLQYAKSTIITCLATTLVLAFVVIVSKGNSARIENNHSAYHPHLWLAFWYCARSVAYYTTIYLFNPLFIFAYLMMGFWFHSKNEVPFVVSKRDFTVVLCCFVLSGIMVYLPLHLFESSVPFPRVTSLFFFVFFHAVLLVVFCNAAAIFRFVNKVSFNRKNMQVAVTVVLIMSAFTTKNFVLVCKDLINGTAMKYNQESYQRYDTIRLCKRDTCFVSPHQYWPYFAQSSKDEISDPNHFQHMNVYFKKTILFK